MRHFAFEIQVTVEKIQRVVIGGDDFIVNHPDAPAATNITARIGVVIQCRVCWDNGNFPYDGLVFPVQSEQAAALADTSCPDNGSEIYVHTKSPGNLMSSILAESRLVGGVAYMLRGLT